MILITCQTCGCENQVSEETTNWEELYCELCGEELSDIPVITDDYEEEE
jgi:peptide subunit release factor 1 (eRF1)